ncbi:MAG: HNH endonuclease [Chloroflexi bacterium]|nr:HNH endonuclease [Chloroflexota bacterium]
MSTISTSLRREVFERAEGRCEYCLVHSRDTLLPHEPDHILAEKHGGETALDNLALACFHCNRHKGSDISSVDPDTRRLTPLFNPRTQTWSDHFKLEGAEIIALTPEGRVTALILKLNSPERLRVRQVLIDMKQYP